MGVFLVVILQKCANIMSHFEALTDKNIHRYLLSKHLDKLKFSILLRQEKKMQNVQTEPKIYFG